jgi:IS4 transposase
LKERLAKPRQAKARKRAYARLREGVLNLVTRQEAEILARETGFYQREPQEIHAFEFALCCALAAMVEQKRGFASVWRILTAAVGIEVARSAVTQRFGQGSAALLEALFFRAVERMPAADESIQRAKLNQFRKVLAMDGTVLKLSPVLSKLFPATRTNVVDAAAKAHVTADLRARRIVDVTVTGERNSELDEFYKVQDFNPNTLYLVDLGYTSYDLLSLVQDSKAYVLMRLKENANPTVVCVRQGVRQPRGSEGRKLSNVELCKTQDRFDLDAEFVCKEMPNNVTMRVVGLWNPETQRYHRYVTNLPPDAFDVEELAALYRQRWIIELLMKLLKSHCHLDHLDTSNPEALRTHIYASLLAAVVLQSVMVTAAQSAGLPLESISFLTVGIAAPALAIPLLLLWLERKLTYDELAGMILRAIAVGCRDQNPGRSWENAACLR